MEENPLLSIRCLVYNHESYLRKCLDGFVMQKTSFKFEAVVHDDASTDGSADIIRQYAAKYPDIIKPIYEKENQYSKHDGSIIKIMNVECRGKYIAFCEGDDYWTNPNKLQKQVEFLETNPDYGLVHTNNSCIKDGIIMPRLNIENIVDGYIYNDLLVSKFDITTLTVCIRNELMIQCQNSYQEASIKEKWQLGDYPLWLEATLQTKCKFLCDNTATYRILSESASHSTNRLKRYKFVRSFFDVKFYFMKKNNTTEEIRNLVLINYYKKILSFSRYDIKNSLKGLLYLTKVKEINLRLVLRFIKYMFYK